MKRLYSAVSALACLWTFCACGGGYDYGPDEPILENIALACRSITDAPVYSGNFVLNMLFSEEDATLKFLQGQYRADFTEKSPRVTATMTQTVLGTPSAVSVNYEDGLCVTATDGHQTEEAPTSGEFFARFPYVRPFVPETRYISGINALSTAEGRGFQVFFQNPEALLFPLVGDDVYSLAMIKNPRRELMKITDASAVYLMDADTSRLSNFNISFVLRLYETPPYIPNGKTPEADEYALSVRITFNVTFR